MSSWYEQAAAKLKAEYSQVKGQKEQAMRPAVRDVLLAVSYTHLFSR